LEEERAESKKKHVAAKVKHEVVRKVLKRKRTENGRKI
jgi:hypothetical protein